MNSKGHLYTSLAKSFIRVIGCVLVIAVKSVAFLAFFLLVGRSVGNC